MDTDSKRASSATDINAMVAAILDDVAERPVPNRAESRLNEIRRAVAEGTATIGMALDIIRLFPNDEAS